jgi:predicted phage terminase large subunit-like protein
LGKDPRLRILLVTYGDGLAKQLCDEVRDLMRSEWYSRSFETRIREDHSRSGDFKTREGGGVFATLATGAITGRAADVVLYDDPHEISDWNDDRKLDLVKDNLTTLLSRLNDKVRGRMIIVAHRVSDNDLSSHLLKEDEWTFIQLPFIAVATETYDLGHGKWTREKGNVLRPKAHTPSQIEYLQRTQKSPPFDLLYQQGLGPRSSQTARPEDFQCFNKFTILNCPVVLSIDPGQSGATNASRSVIQAWKFYNEKYYLVDQFCESVDAEGLGHLFWRSVKRNNPSVALIEKTANGWPLYAAVQRKAKFSLQLVTPRRVSKADRLADHMSKIRSQQIYLPETAIWRDGFIDEVVNFPSEFDDQVDAMTQYLDFIDGCPRLPPPSTRAGPAIAYGRLLSRNYRY